MANSRATSIGIARRCLRDLGVALIVCIDLLHLNDSVAGNLIILNGYEVANQSGLPMESGIINLLIPGRV
jgi:hypothetical protein